MTREDLDSIRAKLALPIMLAGKETETYAGLQATVTVTDQGGGNLGVFKLKTDTQEWISLGTITNVDIGDWNSEMIARFSGKLNAHKVYLETMPPQPPRLVRIPWKDEGIEVSFERIEDVLAAVQEHLGLARPLFIEWVDILSPDDADHAHGFTPDEVEKAETSGAVGHRRGVRVRTPWGEPALRWL